MENIVRAMVSHEALASWAGAFASFAAVFWGVWQVSRDARERRAERNEHTHETISCAEDVLIIWDKLASAIKSQDGDHEALADFTKRYGSQRLQLQRCIDTLQLLVSRPALSDGSIKCAVQARYLAIELEHVLRDHSSIAHRYSGFEELVRRLLTDIKRIRRSHRIRSRRFPHVYQNINEAAIDAVLREALPAR